MSFPKVLLIALFLYGVDAQYLEASTDDDVLNLQLPHSGYIETHTDDDGQSWLDAYFSQEKEKTTKSQSIASALASAASNVLAKLSEPTTTAAPTPQPRRLAMPYNYYHPVNAPRVISKPPHRLPLDYEAFPPEIREYIEEYGELPPLVIRRRSYPPTNVVRHKSKITPIGDGFKTKPRENVVPIYEPIPQPTVKPEETPVINSHIYLYVLPEDFTALLQHKDSVNTNPNAINKGEIITALATRTRASAPSLILASSGVPISLGLTQQQIQGYNPFQFAATLKPTVEKHFFSPTGSSSIQRPDARIVPTESKKVMTLPEYLAKHQANLRGQSQIFGQSTQISTQHALPLGHLTPAGALQMTSTSLAPAITTLDGGEEEQTNPEPSALNLNSEDIADIQPSTQATEAIPCAKDTSTDGENQKPDDSN